MEPIEIHFAVFFATVILCGLFIAWTDDAKY